MRALTNEELRLVTGGQDGGGGSTGGGDTGGGDTGGGDTGGGYGYDIPNPFGDGDDNWSGYYNDSWGTSGDYTTSGVQYRSDDGWTVRVGTLDHRNDPGSVDGAQVTVTVPIG